MDIQVDQPTIRHLFDRTVRLHTDLPTIAFAGDPPITYGELETSVQRVAVALIRHQIQPGHKVVILGDNSPQWVIAYCAATTIGAVAVPVLPGFPDADIRHIVRDSESTAAFVGEKYRPVLDGMRGSDLTVVFSLEDFSSERLQETMSDYMHGILNKLKKKIGSNPDDASIYNALDFPDPSDLAAIIYTSGTTGHSKGVMLTHENIASNVVFGIQRFPIHSSDVFLSILPLAHTFEATGGMLCPLTVGSSIYYMKGLPTPQKLLNAMEQVRPTGVLTVPLVVDKIYRKQILPKLQSKALLRNLYRISFFRRILNKAAGRKMIQSLGGRLRFFMFGGAALNVDVEQFLRDAGISYSTGYGMTETAPIMTINPFGKVRVGSCGQPIPGIEMKIHKPDSDTGVGEICVRGPIVMKGYYKNPETTRAIFLEDGWLRTGDLGRFDQDGYLYIRGRSKNVIVGPNGENIYPEIIEQQLLFSPFIQESVVYLQGDKLIAKVYPDGDRLDLYLRSESDPAQDRQKRIDAVLETVRRETNTALPAFSRLHKLEVYPEPFEKTPTNKVKRYLYVPNDA